MENPKYLLSQGLTLWNTLRVQQNYAFLDMSDIDLMGWNLIGFDLRFINFTNTNLKGVQLTGANLTGCNFTNADLSYAHLREAYLAAADFTQTNLTGTHFNMTRFLNTRLADCFGLETCDHQGASMMDQGSLKYSKNIPEDFLYGLGLSEWEIEAAKLNNEDLTSDELNSILKNIYCSHSIQPDTYYNCFISYSRFDEDFAKILYEKLNKLGVKCWMDRHAILPGDDLRDQIHEGIDIFDKVVLCCSKSSLNSYWVNHEIDKALKKEELLWNKFKKRKLALIPLNLDDYIFEWNSSRASEIGKRHIEDLTNWDSTPQKLEYAMKRIERSLLINKDFH